MSFKSFLVFTFLLISQNSIAEVRCGWVDGVPGVEQWLTDAESSWLLLKKDYSNEHLSFKAKGIEMLETPTYPLIVDTMPFEYYCACLSLDTNKETKQVLKIHSVSINPIKTCLDDLAIDKKVPSPQQAERDQYCFEDYAQRGYYCDLDNPGDEEAFFKCLLPVKNHARRCCKSGSDRCGDFIPEDE